MFGIFTPIHGPIRDFYVREDYVREKFVAPQQVNWLGTQH
jgi:hypothetical protein